MGSWWAEIKPVTVFIGLVALLGVTNLWALTALDTDGDGAPDISEVANNTSVTDPMDWPQPFSDISNAHPSYTPTLWGWEQDLIEECAAGIFCPNQVPQKQLAAKWLLAAIESPGYFPPSAVGDVYTDVDISGLYADWVEEAERRGIVLDCDGNRFCPTQVLTRVVWAIMVVKAKNASGYQPPAAIASPFSDINIGIPGVFGDGDPYADWIIHYARNGSIPDCIGDRFCPNNVLTRSAMIQELAGEFDIDGDWIRNLSDPDRDGDGVDNLADLFPDDASDYADMDMDSLGDNNDPDKDGDGLANANDPFPDNPSDIAGMWAMDQINSNLTPDASANGFDAMVYSAGLVPGKQGNALNFSGASDYLSIPYEALQAASDMTLGMWVRTSSALGQTVFSGAEIYNDNSTRLDFETPSRLCYYHGVRIWPRECWTITPINDGVWHHVVIVRDDFNDLITLYIDGESYGQDYNGIDTIKLEPNGLVVAQDQDEVGGDFDDNDVFDGDIDDLRIYRRPLDRAAITNWYNETNWLSIERQVSQSEDDAERPGSPSLTSYSLDFYRDMVGVRFTQVGVPSGATIEKAFIEWTATSAQSSVITIPIRGELHPDPVTFGISHPIDSRVMTSASVNWSPEPWVSRGTYRTPDLSLIVQEVIDQPGWGIGNAMAFIIDEDSGGSIDRRSAFSWNASAMNAPRLVIYYDDVSADQSPPSVPTNLAGSSISNPVKLTWQDAIDPDSSIAKYRVYRGLGSTLMHRIADIKYGTSFSDGTALPNTRYFYQVSAINGAGLEGGRSSSLEITTADNDLVINHLRFDDSSSTIATDIAGNELHGTVHGGQWLSGQFNGALQLDGIDDYVSLPGQILDGAGDMSIGFWIKTTKNTPQVLVNGANTRDQDELVLSLASNVEVEFYASNNRLDWDIDPINDDQWHHIFLVIDDIYNVVTLYIDGVSQGTQRLSLDFSKVPVNGLILGQYQDGVGDINFDYGFEGELDDFRVYHQVLNWLEIQQVVSGDITPPGTPQNFAVQAGLGQQTLLTWDIASDDETGICGYRIYRGDSAGDLVLLATVANVTSYTDANTLENTTYYYQISAVNCVDGESALSSTVNIITGDDAMLSFTPINPIDWNETAVRKVLHGFAYAGLTSDTQINIWANMPAGEAIVEMLSFDFNNEKLSPSEDSSSNHASSLEELQNFWGGNDPFNPMRWDKRRFYSTLTSNINGDTIVNGGNLERTFSQAVATRGLNPFLHKVAFYLTNYHMSISIRNTRPALIRNYYDVLMGALTSGKNFVEVATAGAKSAAVTRAYDHDFNEYHNDIMEFEGNDDFAREYFQLFFRIQGETEDHDYHEQVTIENNAHLLTGMRLDREPNAYGSTNVNDWRIAPIDFTDHVDGMGDLHYNQTLHHGNCLEILHQTICGANAAEKLEALAPHAASHIESLNNIPVNVVNFFADDNLTDDKIESIQASWRSAGFDLLKFIRAYAISTAFHSADTYKLRSSFDRALSLFNTIVLDNQEVFLGLEYWKSTERWLGEQGLSVFAPIKDVFGHQSGLQAVTNPNIFKQSYDFQIDYTLFDEDRTTYFDDETETTQSTWYKDWGSVAPRNGANEYVVSEVADWLWQRLIADGGKNFDIVAKAQIYALLARGFDFGYVVTTETAETNTERVFSSNELTTDSELIALISQLGAETIALDDIDLDGVRRIANLRVGQAAQFIGMLPYTFVLEGK